MDRQKMEGYAELVRLIVPLDDDLYTVGASAEAIKTAQNLASILREDFERQFGLSYTDVPGDN